MVDRQELWRQLRYRAAPLELRLGQYFVNRFVPHGTWPELFYCTNELQAVNMIALWMENNCYNTLDEVR